MDGSEAAISVKGGSRVQALHQSTVAVHASSEWWRSHPLPPSKMISNEAFAEILSHTGSVLVLSRADSALFCLSEVGGQVRVTPYRMPGPMGLAYLEKRLVLGCAADIRTFVDISPQDACEALFMPVAIYSTGALSIHDLAWGESWQIWFTNTLFSTVCTLDLGSGVRHEWAPSFIQGERLASDACHLNGMVVAGNSVQYATALAPATEANGWRPLAPDAGVLLNADGEIVEGGLSLPHSPQMVNGRLHLLESGRGKILRYNDRLEVIAEVDAFIRGAATTSEMIIVGSSPVRPTSGPVTDRLRERFKNTNGCAIHAFTHGGSALGTFQLPFVNEISSLHILPHRQVSFLQPSAAERAATLVYHR